MLIGMPLQSLGRDDLSVPLAVEVVVNRVLGPLHAVLVEGFDPTIERDDTHTTRRGAVLGRKYVLGVGRSLALAHKLGRQHAAIAGESSPALVLLDRGRS